MERKSLCKSLKDHSIGAQDHLNTNQLHHHHHHPHHHPKPNMFKTSWITTPTTTYQSYGEHHHHHHHHTHHDYIGGGLSWPPRSYACTFCKREFRSAQALGGHMNVHRRDRARLRQSSPPATTAASSSDGQYSFLSLNPGNTNPIPNPNPNFSSSSSSTFASTRSHAPLNTTFSSFVPQIHLGAPIPSSRFGSTSEMKVIEGDFLDGPSSRVKNQARVEDIDPWTKGWMNDKGFIKLGMEVEVVKEDLDLELRLGFP